MHSLLLGAPLTLDDLDRVDEIRRLVQRELPPHHKALTEVLFLFLTMVAGHASTNKLSAYELATIFAPLLLRQVSHLSVKSFSLTARSLQAPN